MRLAEVFAGQGAGSNQIFEAVLTLADWVCNVILPVYGSLEIVRAVLGWSGVGSRLNIGDDWIRHVAAAMAAFCCSGILRLFERFTRSWNKRGGLMALQVSPISRNLALKVTVMFLEVEDMLALGFACAVVMLAGQFVFSDRYIFLTIPMNLVSGSGGVGTRDSGPDAFQIRQAAPSILPILFA